MAFSTGIGVLVPQVNAEYVHEFMDDQRAINVQLVQDVGGSSFSFKNDSPDRNYFNLGAGVVLQLPAGFSAFADFVTMVGNDQFDSYKGSIGIRIEL